jgi:hypothetical protein
MKRFAQLCRKEPKVINLKNASEFHGLKVKLAAEGEECLVKVNIFLEEKAESPVLQAHVLPMQWTLFKVSKQRNAQCTSTYFHRVGQADELRFEATLAGLRKTPIPEQIVWVGTPGIGKSSGLNFVLVELLRHLGENGWPPLVVVRIEKRLVWFRMDTVEITSLPNIEDLLSESEDIAKEKGVLVLELADSEVGIELHCGAVLSLSNRDVHKEFQGMKKAGARFFVIGPWARQELQAAGCVQFCLGQLDPTLGDSLLEVQAGIAGRYSEVGGIPRLVFSKVQYERHLEDKRRITQALFFKDLEEISLFHVTAGAKYFLSPSPVKFTKSDLEEDSKLMLAQYSDHHSWQWTFLSSKLAAAAAELCQQMPKKVEAMLEFGVRFQLEEAIAEVALLDGFPVASPFHTHKWEWIADPGHKHTIERPMICAPPAGFQMCTRLNEFPGRVFVADVRTLEEKTLYGSSGWQMVLGEWLSVSHSERTVFMYQVSDQPPPEHAFSLSNVNKVRTSLSMDVEQKYKLVIVYLMDSGKAKSFSSSQVKGLAIKDGETKTKKLSSLKDHGELEVSGFIVRASLVPGRLKQEILGEVPVDLKDDTPVFHTEAKTSKYHIVPNCSALKSTTKHITHTTYAEVGQHKTLCATCKTLQTEKNAD